MTDIDETLSELTGKLREERDRLRVRIHLAGAEIKDEWEEMEEKWEHFRSQSGHVLDEAAGATREAGEAAKLLGQELYRGYKRIRDAF